MKSKKMMLSLIALIACLVIVGIVYVITTSHPEEKEVLAELPRVGVDGNRLVDNHNGTIRLRGVSIADPYFLDHYDHHFSEDIFAELSGWNVNAVRIPIHPGWWQAEDNYCQKYLDAVIGWGRKYGFYTILDWHAIGNPLTGETQNPGWKEKGHTVYNSSLELAESAWRKLSQTYGGNSSVIFELFNEPAPIGELTVDYWRDWKDNLTELIDKIRMSAPNTLILVSGWQWTYDLRGYATYPIQRDNIAYVAHVYPNHLEWEYYFGFLSDTHPVIVTEWGFSPDLNPTENLYGTRETFGDPFLEYMNDKNISWTAWCFHPTWQPNMLANWSFGLTEEGSLVKHALVTNSTH